MCLICRPCEPIQYQTIRVPSFVIVDRVSDKKMTEEEIKTTKVSRRTAKGECVSVPL